MEFPKLGLGSPNLCGCCQSWLELVAPQLQEVAWAVLGTPAGTWPRGPCRCCTENGASQALVGHGGPVRAWGELEQPEPPALIRLTPLHPKKWGCWLEGL